MSVTDEPGSLIIFPAINTSESFRRHTDGVEEAPITLNLTGSAVDHPGYFFVSSVLDGPIGAVGVSLW
jgi:hypothetical protein